MKAMDNQSQNKKIKVLHIEDDLSSRLLVRNILNKPPFEYLEAATGFSGLKKALKEKPDLILMDINLPDISGNELTTKIKNTKELEGIVVVALTGMTAEHAREITLVAGCDGFLTKPIDVKKFPEQILQFLQGKKESLESAEKEYFHSQYEVTLVEHLTSKVQELEKSNRKLSNTSQKLKDYSTYLEKILTIINQLQLCSNPQDLKKSLIDQLSDSFHYDRCIFIDVNEENMVMQINYARGINPDEWDRFSYPFNNSYFQEIFANRQVVYVPRLSLVEDPHLRQKLKEFGINNFLIAYLGTPVEPIRSAKIREDIKPMLEPYLPRLYNQEEADLNIISDNLQEFLLSKILYRGGFVFLDNYLSRRRILPYEYRFLESLFHTVSYMYQNILLMEELSVMFVRAEREAITDPLTELFNYRYFMQHLNREINRNQRHQSHFSLIMIDIDYFKDYNDQFGHQIGDLILRRIARLLMKNTRISDIVSRYGGEEFAIICPELDKGGALRMAEKLRQIVQDTDFPRKGKFDRGELTISLGVATFPEDGENAFKLIRSADQALYKAKKSGRNKVCSTSNKM
ncbi:MAG: hypothetical protein Kow0042_26800 [Calditrichia bacterium]